MTNEFETLENALIRAGRELEFPPTPAIAARVRVELNSPAPSRVNLSWWRVWVPVALAILLAVTLLFAFPVTRDAVAQFLGLPGLRIFYVTPTPTATATMTVRPTDTLSAQSVTPTGTRPRPTVTPTITRTPTPTAQPFAVCCLVSLAQAKQLAKFKLLIPPNETPTQVYYENIYDSGQQIVMVFGDPAKPRFTLYQAQGWVYGKLVDAGKGIGTQTQLGEAQVKGERALWFSGAPHLVVTLDARGEPIYDTARTVDANTLVWQTGNEYSGVIYRLETKGTLQDAVKLAESLIEAP